jgi:hypothetical protein
MNLFLRACLRVAPIAFVVAMSVGACDPVVDDAIAALGPENPLVRRGPEHRPGQPCLLCHDGALGDPPAFSVAGTIYETPSSTVGVQGATITLVDSSGSRRPYVTQPTNDAGNFYVTPSEWTPTFPITTIAVTSAKAGFATMKSSIGRSASCATCHFPPNGPPGSSPAWGPDTPGQVVIVEDDGGTPP